MSISKSRRDDCNHHYELKTAEKLFTCDGCKMKGFGPRYTCKLCGDELHVECRNPKNKINNECFPGSTFEFRDAPLTKSTKCCDACGKEILGFNYRCEADNLDLHPCCRKLEKKRVIDGTVYNLVSKVSSKCKRCDKKEISSPAQKVPEWSYVSTCGQYNFHFYCMTEMAHEAYMKHGNSALEKVDSKKLALEKVDLKKLTKTEATFGQLCKMSLSKSLPHDCNDHYELKTAEKHFTCDGCKMKGFGPRYTCNLCKDELHEECRNPETKINPECFPCSTFTFLENPVTRFNKSSKRCEYSNCCDACGKEICGFSYHCEANNLDLHPCCRKLKEKLPINDTVFNLEPKVSSKCQRCDKKKLSGADRKVPGWSYVSTCRQYNFHVYCMTEMVQEACMKHGNSALEKVDSKKLALEKVDLKKLTKTKRNGKIGRTTFQIIKSFVQIIVSILLGDPTSLIANVVVELFTGG